MANFVALYAPRAFIAVKPNIDEQFIILQVRQTFEPKDGTLRTHPSGLRTARTSLSKPMMHGKRLYQLHCQWSQPSGTHHVGDSAIGKRGALTGGIGGTTTGRSTKVIFRTLLFFYKNTIQTQVQQFWNCVNLQMPTDEPCLRGYANRPVSSLTPPGAVTAIFRGPRCDLGSFSYFYIGKAM